jgi:hypothetical protein
MISHGSHLLFTMRTFLTSWILEPSRYICHLVFCARQDRGNNQEVKFVVQPYRERKIHFFETLNYFIDLSEQPLSSDVAESMIAHMRSLASQLHLYFSLCPEKKTTGWKLPFLTRNMNFLLSKENSLSSCPVIRCSKCCFLCYRYWSFGSKLGLFNLKFPKGPFATTYLCKTTLLSSCTYEKQIKEQT